MSNNGLKNKSEIISRAIDNTELLCNVSKYHGNISLIINIVSTLGANKLDFSLYFDLYNDSNIGFGKGLTCNLYKKIEYSNNSYFMTTYDGFQYEFVCVETNKYYNSELNQTIVKESGNSFYLDDGFENKYEYSNVGNYPSLITQGNSNYKVVLTILNNRIKKIETKSGSRVISTINISYTTQNNEYILSSIICDKPNNVYNFTYNTYNNLTSVTSKISSSSTYFSNVSYNLSQYSFSVINNINKKRCLISFELNTQDYIYEINSIQDDYYINNQSVDPFLTSITHYNSYTKTDDNHGNINYLYYSNEQIEYIIDNNYNLEKIIYDNYLREIGIFNKIAIPKNGITGYNLINNGYFENTSPLSNWSFVGTSNYGYSTNSNRPLSNVLGTKYLYIYNSGNSCYFNQTISRKGSEIDDYTLVFWYKQLSLGYSSAYDLTVELDYISTLYGEDISHKCIYNFPHRTVLDTNWHPVVLNVSKYKNFDSINIKISLPNMGVGYAFDGFLLINNNVELLSSYYLYGKIEKSESGNKKINYIHNYYDSNNAIDKIGMIIDDNGRITKYTYDNNCYNVIEEELGSRKVTRVFDSTEKNNLIKETISNNNDKLIKEYVYTDSCDYIKTEIDYDNSETNYTINEDRGLVTKESYPSGNNMNYGYNNDNLLYYSSFSNSQITTTLGYSYTGTKLLSRISRTNHYLYSYNYTNHKLNSVDVADNNTLLEAYEYETSFPYQIKKIKKGSYGDEVKFTYNTLGNLTKVSYKLKGESVFHDKYNYIYDEINPSKLNRVITIGYDDNIYKDFEYDVIGNIKSIYDDYNHDYSINYIYDNYDLMMKSFYMDNYKRLEVLPCDSKKLLATKNDLKKSAIYQLSNTREKYYSFFDGLIGKNFLRLINSTNKSNDVTKVVVTTMGTFISSYDDNGNFYLPLAYNSDLEYAIPAGYLNPASNSLINGSFGFLFKLSSINNIQTIFSLYDGNGSTKLIVEKYTDDKMVIKLFDSENDLVFSNNLNKKCIVNDINYFGLSFSIDLSTSKIKIRCVFNNETYNFDSERFYDELIFNKFSIGGYKGLLANASTINLYSLMFMPLNYNTYVLSTSELIKNYHLLKDVYETSNDETDILGLDLYKSNSIYNLNKFVPLSNSFLSNQNNKPVHLDKRYDEDCVRNKYFKYIDSENKSMLKLDGINLVYDFLAGDAYTIAGLVMFSRFFEKNYIYTIKGSNKHISLVAVNNYLYLEIGNTLTNTNIPFLVNDIYFISIGLEYNTASSSYNIRIVVNDFDPFETNVVTTKVNNPLLIIGSKGMNEEVDHFMDGYISSLCYNNNYMCVSSLNNLRNELNPLRTETKIDGLGRIEGKIVKKGDYIINTSYSYKQVEDTPSTNKETLFIESEITQKGTTTLLQRSYEYGTGSSYGNITKIRENNSLINQYYYDEKGYLIISYDIPYGKNDNFEYDNNGNITRRLIRSNIDGTIYDDILFYYDTTWPDRVVQIGSKKIDYDSDSIGCPKHYGTFVNGIFTSGITYSWRCSKLIGLTDSINSRTISYDYDEKEKRIRKTVNGVNHNYYYEGNRLLTETYSNNRLDFLYDENNSIIGFDYTNGSNTNRYYYIKNILGDVIKIVDNSGTDVVSYKYSSYGEMLSISDNTSINIGTINPFRYRSYYYDTDTSMYYLKTRYYNPYWCRFISSDNISYLEYDNPLGVNLFSYCNNNPVMCRLGYNLGGVISAPISNIGSISSNISSRNRSSSPRSMSRLSALSTPFANVVSMTNYSTTLVENILIGMALGNISHTTTIQHNNSGVFYAYSNIGNSTTSVGAGLNIKDWYGLNAYVSSNIGIGSSMQLGSITYGAEISVLDGVSFSFGTVTGNVTNEETVSIGWGTLAFAYAACGAIAATPVPMARAVATVAVCVVVLIDIFN